MKKILICLALLFPLLATAQLPTAVRTTNGTAVNLTVSNQFIAGPIGSIGPWLSVNSNGNSLVQMVDQSGNIMNWSAGALDSTDASASLGTVGLPWSQGYISALNMPGMTGGDLSGFDGGRNVTSIAVGSGLSLSGGTLSTTAGPSATNFVTNINGIATNLTVYPSSFNQVPMTIYTGSSQSSNSLNILDPNGNAMAMFDKFGALNLGGMGSSSPNAPLIQQKSTGPNTFAGSISTSALTVTNAANFNGIDTFTGGNSSTPMMVISNGLGVVVNAGFTTNSGYNAAITLMGGGSGPAWSVGLISTNSSNGTLISTVGSINYYSIDNYAGSFASIPLFAAPFLIPGSTQIVLNGEPFVVSSTSAPGGLSAGNYPSFWDSSTNGHSVFPMLESGHFYAYQVTNGGSNFPKTINHLALDVDRTTGNVSNYGTFISGGNLSANGSIIGTRTKTAITSYPFALTLADGVSEEAGVNLESTHGVVMETLGVQSQYSMAMTSINGGGYYNATTVAIGNAELGDSSQWENSTLFVNGSLGLVVTNTGGSYTTGIGDSTVLLSSGASPTLEDATYHGKGKIHIFKNKLGANTSMTLATTSSQTIDRATSYVLTNPDDAIWVQDNGTNWEIIANYVQYRAGQQAISSLSTSQAVTFSSPLPTTNYAVSITADATLAAAVGFGATSKTTNGFTITLSGGISGGVTVDYTATMNH